MMHESRSKIKELYNYRKTSPSNSVEKKAKIEHQTESSDDG